jgi:hypothetical protein
MHGVHFGIRRDGKLGVLTPLGEVVFDDAFDAREFLVQVLDQQLGALAKFAQLVEQSDGERAFEETPY